ncbi:MAG: hypothetical protein M1114_06770, partial [Candidatus Dependentiae bacterium]|nr:hypothetical protein [Candidatus Dependentiae bacterium]
MDFKVTYRHMESSPEIEAAIKRDMAKILLFLENEPTPVFINLTITPGKLHAHHEVELLVKSPHYDLFGKEEGANFFVLLGTITDTMYKRLEAEK